MRWFALMCAWFLLGWSREAGARGTVDLHAHLFMEEALGWLYRGSFDDDALAADSWDDRLSSKTNLSSLEASGLSVVVIALFAHPVYRADMREAVRRQIARAEQLARDHDGWAIAKNAKEARAILASGRRVLVLSLEGASGVIESSEDLREFVEERGISIVTPLHLVDDRFGGVATLNGFQYFANPHGVVEQLLDGHEAALNDTTATLETNRRGLTKLGRRLAIELVRRGVWLDLTHASDAALDELVPIALAGKQPLLFTHTTLRRHRHAERALSDAMLARVAASGGIVGLLPSEDAFGDAPPAGMCSPQCTPCTSSVHAFARMYSDVSAVLGADAVMLGSDHNGGMRHLSQACGTHSALDDEAGLYHIGQTQLLWDTMRALGAPVPKDGAQVERFLRAWEAVTPQVLDDAGLPPMGARREIEGPSLAVKLGVGVSGGNTAGPALLAQLDLSVRKDVASEVEVEPIFYLAHLGADVSLTPGNERLIDYGEGFVAPAGVRLRHGDSRLEGEALRVLWRRHAQLDQDRLVRVMLLHGAARVTPGWLRYPGQHNLFVQLETELLGYEQIGHVSAREDVHAFYVGEAGLLGGSTLFPHRTLLFSIYGGIGASMALLDRGFHSDIGARAGATFGMVDGTFAQFFEARYLMSREPEGDMLTAPHFRGGVSVAF